MAIAGVILAGGLARRMGGGDKPLRLLAGRPIIGHVIARLRPQLSGLAINANGDPGRLAGFGLPVVEDTIPGHQGPLAGILAGLLWVRKACPGATHLLTMPGDTPFLPADLVARLDRARVRAGAQIAQAESGGKLHPVVSLWAVELVEPLGLALDAGVRRVRAFQEGFPVVVESFAVDGGDPFHNVNTPEDLAEAERLAAHLAAAG
jgi:molybdopterin-guanine dinucleotide biosynthesis protein A